MDPSPPISFGESRSFIEDARSVLFFARRGERTLRCYLTWDATVVTAEECLQAYDCNAAAIHAMARRLIDEAPLAGGGIVMSAEDLLDQRATMEVLR